MAIDKVREYFKPYQMNDHILEFEVSSATVELAAEALHCEGKRIAKTMSFLVGDQPILIVTAGDTKIDNAKYKHFFGTKAKMIPGDEVERINGHAIGCVFVVFFHKYYVSRFFCNMFHKFSHYILGGNVSRETLCSMIFI